MITYIVSKFRIPEGYEVIQSPFDRSNTLALVLR
jgi:hypothetical protein